jgi:hypothetical protein
VREKKNTGQNTTQIPTISLIYINPNNAICEFYFSSNNKKNSDPLEIKLQSYILIFYLSRPRSFFSFWRVRRGRGR